MDPERDPKTEARQKLIGRAFVILFVLLLLAYIVPTLINR